MKRFLCLLLLIIFPLALFACNRNENTNDDVTPDDGGDKNQTVLLAPIKIMSYNVQTGSVEKVLPRVPKVVETIEAYAPDVIGAQEINAYWIASLEECGFFDEYTMVGEPRDHADSHVAGNEYSAIFFKTESFNLIDSGTFWLSDTPDEISKLDCCDYYRIMTYAVLERKSDGYRFLHVNTHLEWAHKDIDTNLLQTEIMLSLTEDILAESGDLPVFFTGDFNEPSDSDGYAAMIDFGVEDTREEAKTTSDAPTFPSQKLYIDFCFVSEKRFEIESFEVGTDCEGSDHSPLIIQVVPIQRN